MGECLGRAAVAALLLACGAARAVEAAPQARRDAVTAFGGVLTDENWDRLVVEPHDIDFEDAGLLGLAYAREVARPLDGLALELEGQLVRYFGGQAHWEVNAPIAVARWSAFPWDETVDTSAAFGLGVSVASEVPAKEAENEGDSGRVLAYWLMEVALARPGGDWELLGRIHHRSTAFGTFGDDGGSNALVLGLRRRF